MMKQFILLISILFVTTGCEINQNENGQAQMDVKIEELVFPYKDFESLTMDEKDIIYACVSTENNRNVNTLIAYNPEIEESKILYKSRFEKAIMQDTSVNEDYLMWVDMVENSTDTAIMVMDKKMEKSKKFSERIQMIFSLYRQYYIIIMLLGLIIQILNN